MTVITEELLTEKEWYKKTIKEATLYGVPWGAIRSWINDAKCKGFDVKDYLHRGRVGEAIKKGYKCPHCKAENRDKAKEIFGERLV